MKATHWVVLAHKALHSGRLCTMLDRSTISLARLGLQMLFRVNSSKVWVIKAVLVLTVGAVVSTDVIADAVLNVVDALVPVVNVVLVLVVDMVLVLVVLVVDLVLVLVVLVVDVVLVLVVSVDVMVSLVFVEVDRRVLVPIVVDVNVLVLDMAGLV